MLRKSNKLSRSDFDEVFKNGSLHHSHNLTTRIFHVVGETNSAFSVVVSKKVSKYAFVRNMAKRKVYSVLKAIIPTLNKGYKGIIILKPSSLKLSKEDLRNEIEKHLKNHK